MSEHARPEIGLLERVADGSDRHSDASDEANENTFDTTEVGVVADALELPQTAPAQHKVRDGRYPLGPFLYQLKEDHLLEYSKHSTYPSYPDDRPSPSWENREDVVRGRDQNEDHRVIKHP